MKLFRLTYGAATKAANSKSTLSIASYAVVEQDGLFAFNGGTISKSELMKPVLAPVKGVVKISMDYVGDDPTMGIETLRAYLDVSINLEVHKDYKYVISKYIDEMKNKKHTTKDVDGDA